MNVDLVENSVKYHGKKLLDLILSQNNCEPLTENVSDRKNEQHYDEKYQNLAKL
jgi:hypothetical protein